MTDHDRRPTSFEQLRHLPTPEHGPSFWVDLDARLRREASARTATRSTPAPQPITAEAVEVVEAQSAQDGGDRRVAHVRQGLLLVAAAIVALVGATIVRGAIHDRPEHRVTVTNPSPPPSVASGAAKAKADAVAWLDALARGDMRTAWDHLGPVARGSWATFDQFAARRAEFSGGLATWANADDLHVGAVAVDAEGEPARFVVTITGTRHVEGTDETGGIAMIVQQPEGSGYLVEPSFPAGSTGIQLTAPAGGNADGIAAETPVTATAPPGGRLVFVVDRDAVTVTPARTSTGAASYRPSAGWTPGRHVITAVITGMPIPLAAVIVFDVPPPQRRPGDEAED